MGHLTEEERRRFAEFSSRNQESSSPIAGKKLTPNLPMLRSSSQRGTASQRGADAPASSRALPSTAAERLMPAQLVEDLRHSLDGGRSLAKHESLGTRLGSLLLGSDASSSPRQSSSGTSVTQLKAPPSGTASSLSASRPALPRLSLSGARGPADPNTSGSLPEIQSARAARTSSLIDGPSNPSGLSTSGPSGSYQQGRGSLSGLAGDLPAYLLRRPVPINTNDAGTTGGVGTNGAAGPSGAAGADDSAGVLAASPTTSRALQEARARSSFNGSRLAAALRSTGRVSNSGNADLPSPSSGPRIGLTDTGGRVSLDGVARGSMGQVGAGNCRASRLKAPALDEPLGLGELARAFGVLPSAGAGQEKAKRMSQSGTAKAQANEDSDTERQSVGLARFKKATHAVLRRIKGGAEEEEESAPSSTQDRASTSRTKPGALPQPLQLTNLTTNNPDSPSYHGPAGPHTPRSRVHELLHPPTVRSIVNMHQDMLLKSRGALLGLTNSVAGGLSGGGPSAGGGKGGGVGKGGGPKPRGSDNGSGYILDLLPDTEALPMPANVHRVYHTGVSVKTIMRLGALLPQEPISTETVAREHLMPLTRKYAAKLVDLVSQQAVNMPKMYVIHAWSANFHDLVNALKRYCLDTNQDPSTTYVFVDLFCCNMAAKITARDLGTVRDVVGCCKDILLVVDSQAQVFSRLWCTYEAWLACTCHSGGKGVKGGEHLKLLLYSADAHTLSDGIQCLRPHKLHCTTTEDHKLILDDMANDDTHPKTTLTKLVEVVSEGLLTSVRTEVSKSLASVKSNARRYVLSLTKMGLVMMGAGQHWEAEKALRQILQLPVSHDKHLERDEEMRHKVHLSQCMLQRGFLDEAERLATEGRLYFERLIVTEGSLDCPIPAPAQGQGDYLTVGELCKTPKQMMMEAMIVLTQVLLTRDCRQEADKLLQQLLGERPWEPTSIASRFHQHSNTGSCHDDNPAPCSLESIPPTPTTPYTPTTPTTPATPYTPNGCFSPGTPNSNVGFADVTLSFDNVRDHIECLRLMAEVQQRACKDEAAVKYMRSALKQACDALGQSHLLVAQLRYTLAEWLHQAARDAIETADCKLDEARRALAGGSEYARTSLSGTDTLPPNTDPNTARTFRSATAAISSARADAQRRLGSARELTEQALATYKDVHGVDSVPAIEARVLLLHIAMSLDQHASIESDLEQIISLCESVYGSNNPASLSARDAAVRLREYYTTQGRAASRKMDDSRAEDMLRRALAVNVLVGLGAEQEDKSITRMLQEVQKRLGRRSVNGTV